jgi:hypothetical protein
MEAQSFVKGYKQISLSDLQNELKEGYKRTGKTYIELAYEMEIKSITTIQNILTSADQIFSDEMLTKFIKHLGINAFVKWQDGERNYYIKK